MEHLLPNIRKVALLPAKERIARIKKEYWIGYNRAELALNKLEELFDYPRKLRMKNLLIIGPSNNGKTMILEKFRRSHLPYESEDGEHEIIPVLMIQMPSNPSVQRFYATIARALNSPISHYRSSAWHEAIILAMLKTTQTKILIIGELHNILAGNNTRQREFLNIIRFLGNELQISIVGVGIKYAYLAIRSDDQLENRFDPFILPVWQNDTEFIRLLSSFVKILPLQKVSSLLDPDVSAMILERSEGTIGEISSLLIQATCEAIRTEKEYIDIVDCQHFSGQIIMHILKQPHNQLVTNNH
jgi:hypothetical protein